MCKKANEYVRKFILVKVRVQDDAFFNGDYAN